MPRRKPEAVVVCDESNNAPEDVEAGRVNVSVFVPVAGFDESVTQVTFDDARVLLTIEPNDPLWAGMRSEQTTRFPNVKDAIVRVRAPDDASDEEVEGLRRLLELRGAARVSVLPRRRAELLPAEAAAAESDKATTPRAAVAQLVAESNSKDKDALASLCETIASKAGL